MLTNQSLAARLKKDIKDLPGLGDDYQIWEIAGFYLAQLCLSLLLMLSIEVIIVGGGVLNRKCILDIARKYFGTMLNGYVKHPALEGDALAHYIIPASFGEEEGLIGAASTLDFDD